MSSIINVDKGNCIQPNLHCWENKKTKKQKQINHNKYFLNISDRKELNIPQVVGYTLDVWSG